MQKLQGETPLAHELEKELIWASRRPGSQANMSGTSVVDVHGSDTETEMPVEELASSIKHIQDNKMATDPDSLAFATGQTKKIQARM